MIAPGGPRQPTDGDTGSDDRCVIAPGVSDRCGTVLINETNNYWDQLAPFGGMKKSGLGRELSDWMFSEITEIKQISIDISKVRE